MKLQILVPQYKEDFSVIKNLLNSIEIQQDVDLKRTLELSQSMMAQMCYQMKNYLNDTHLKLNI